MTGSCIDLRSCANTALDALAEAYEETHDSTAGSLILTAIDAITVLKEQIREQSGAVLSENDPYEIDEANSAI